MSVSKCSNPRQVTAILKPADFAWFEAERVRLGINRAELLRRAVVALRQLELERVPAVQATSGTTYQRVACPFETCDDQATCKKIDRCRYNPADVGGS